MNNGEKNPQQKRYQLEVAEEAQPTKKELTKQEIGEQRFTRTLDERPLIKKKVLPPHQQENMIKFRMVKPSSSSHHPQPTHTVTGTSSLDNGACSQAVANAQTTPGDPKSYMGRFKLNTSASNNSASSNQRPKRAPNAKKWFRNHIRSNKPKKTSDMQSVKASNIPADQRKNMSKFTLSAEPSINDNHKSQATSSTIGVKRKRYDEQPIPQSNSKQQKTSSQVGAPNSEYGAMITNRYVNPSNIPMLNGQDLSKEEPSSITSTSTKDRLFARPPLANADHRSHNIAQRHTYIPPAITIHSQVVNQRVNRGNPASMNRQGYNENLEHPFIPLASREEKPVTDSRPQNTCHPWLNVKGRPPVDIEKLSKRFLEHPPIPSQSAQVIFVMPQQANQHQLNNQSQCNYPPVNQKAITNSIVPTHRQIMTHTPNVDRYTNGGNTLLTRLNATPVNIKQMSDKFLSLASTSGISVLSPSNPSSNVDSEVNEAHLTNCAMNNQR